MVGNITRDRKARCPSPTTVALCSNANTVLGRLVNCLVHRRGVLQSCSSPYLSVSNHNKSQR